MKRLPRSTYDAEMRAYRYPIPGRDRGALVWLRARGEWFACGPFAKWCVARTRTDAMRGLYAILGVEL